MSVPTAISEMSSQIISLKDRKDLRESSRILALELLEMNSSRNVHPQSDDDEKQG